MKVSILITILLIPFLTFAQGSSSIQLFEKYSGQKDFTSVYITKYTFDFFSKISNDSEASEFKESISTINSIRVLNTRVACKQLNKDINLLLIKPAYEVMMEIKKNGKIIKFFIAEKNKVIKELIMYISRKNKNILIIITGDDIDMEKLSKLSDNMEIGGFKNLKNIDKKSQKKHENNN